MKSLGFLSLLVLSTTSVALADSSPALVCKGENVVLLAQSTYVGEGERERAQEQRIYMLGPEDSKFGDLAYTAYFVGDDVTDDVAPGGDHVISGRINGFDRYFELRICPGQSENCQGWTDISDGTTDRQQAKGRLKYKFAGKESAAGYGEEVNCVLE